MMNGVDENRHVTLVNTLLSEDKTPARIVHIFWDPSNRFLRKRNCCHTKIRASVIIQLHESFLFFMWYFSHFYENFFYVIIFILLDKTIGIISWDLVSHNYVKSFMFLLDNFHNICYMITWRTIGGISRALWLAEAWLVTWGDPELTEHRRWRW